MLDLVEGYEWFIEPDWEAGREALDSNSALAIPG
jgi:hypothetical protein